MDIRDGRIFTPEEIEMLKRDIKEITFPGFGKLPDMWSRTMEIPPTPKQMARKPPRVGRNEACPCGSGKKFKKCCLRKEE